MAAASAVLMGPWGAALAAGAVALGYFMSQQAEANGRVDEFAASIDTATGKLNQAGVAKVAETLIGDISDDDWNTLRNLGITVEDVTAAVIGGEHEWEAYRARLRMVSVQNEDARSIISTLTNNMFGLRKDVDMGTRSWEAAGKALAVYEEINKDVSYTSGTVLAALQKATPQLGLYRDALLSSSGAASALRAANQSAADATDRLTGGLSDLSAEVGRQEALAAYKTSLEAFVTEPSAAAALAVTSAMTTAATAIQDPGDRAKFTRDAVDDIRTAASDAGMKLNPELDAGLQRATGLAKLLETQIDNAVRARTVDITLRFSDSRDTYGSGEGDGPRHGGYTDGWITKGAGGPTSDYAPIWASRGEYVLRAGAAAALQSALGDAGMFQLNHADRSLPSFLGGPIPQITTSGNGEPALVGAGAPVINIGEIRADSGIDVQTEVLWALRRSERIKRERG
jgi:hypothetical protein